MFSRDRRREQEALLEHDRGRTPEGESDPRARRSMPPIRTVAVVGSSSRTSSCASALLPAPVVPDDGDRLVAADPEATPCRTARAVEDGT